MKISVILCVISFAISAFFYLDTVEEINRFSSKLESIRLEIKNSNSSLIFSDRVSESLPSIDGVVESVTYCAFSFGIGLGLLLSVVIKQSEKPKQVITT